MKRGRSRKTEKFLYHLRTIACSIFVSFSLFLCFSNAIWVLLSLEVVRVNSENKWKSSLKTCINLISEEWGFLGIRICSSPSILNLPSVESSQAFLSVWGALDFPGGSVVKNLPANTGDAGGTGSVAGLERWSPGRGNGYPLQYSCLEKFHGQRSLAGYSPWGHKGSELTIPLSTHLISILDNEITS